MVATRPHVATRERPPSGKPFIANSEGPRLNKSPEKVDIKAPPANGLWPDNNPCMIAAKPSGHRMPCANTFRINIWHPSFEGVVRSGLPA
jgi:hypothetical protein